MGSCNETTRLFTPPGTAPVSAIGASFLRIFPIKQTSGVLTADPTLYIEDATPTSSLTYEEMMSIQIGISTSGVATVISCEADLGVRAKIVGAGLQTGKLKWMVSPVQQSRRAASAASFSTGWAKTASARS